MEKKSKEIYDMKFAELHRNGKKIVQISLYYLLGETFVETIEKNYSINKMKE